MNVKQMAALAAIINVRNIRGSGASYCYHLGPLVRDVPPDEAVWTNWMKDHSVCGKPDINKESTYEELYEWELKFREWVNDVTYDPPKLIVTIYDNSFSSMIDIGRGVKRCYWVFNITDKTKPEILSIFRNRLMNLAAEYAMEAESAKKKREFLEASGARMLTLLKEAGC